MADKEDKILDVADEAVVSEETTEVTENAEEVVAEDVTEEVSADVASLFEGEELSEEFKNKASTVFEAVVSERVAAKTETIKEEVEKEFAAKLEESVEEIKENLNDYLDCVVNEWLEENKVAVEAGVKVEMAESLMDGLKGLFYEHNVQIDEDTIDVVSDLEESLDEQTERNNTLVNETIALKKDNAALKASIAFKEICEGLTDTQIDRMKTLSETFDVSDLEEYKEKLGTVKETFFKKDAPAVTESVVTDTEVVVEDKKPETIAEGNVGAYLAFLEATKAS